MKKDRIEMAYYSFVKVGKKMYFSHIFLNGLFEINLDDFTVKFIGRFPDVDNNEFCLHGMGQAIQHKNNLYFFPLNSRVIHCYNLKNGKIESIPLPMETSIETDKYFLGTYKCVIGNKVWLFSRVLSKGVFIFDLESQYIEREDTFSDILAKYKTITNFVETPDRKLHFYSLPDNILIEIDVKNKRVKEYPIQINGIEIGSINYQKGSFWFIDKRTGDIYEWQLGNNFKKIPVSDKIEWISIKGTPFSCCYYVNSKMYIFPTRSKNIMKVDDDVRSIKKAVDYPEDFLFTNKYDEIALFAAFGAYEVVGDEIWFHPCLGNRLLIFNTRLNHIIEKDISMYIGDIYSYEGQHNETQKVSLEFLCHCVKKATIDCQPIKSFQGKEIYEYIIKCS